MPIYTYETIPQNPGDTVERFELKQGMTEDALTNHPDTGVPVKRVITGGLGYVKSDGASSGPAGGG